MRTPEEVAAARKLRCDKCGAHPSDLEAQYTAVVGGPHSRRLTHASGVPGRERFAGARTCGKWVEEERGP